VASQLYKDYLLRSRADFNAVTECWVPRINISWRMANELHYHMFDGPTNLYKSELEAVSQGLLIGRLWVDNKL